MADGSTYMCPQCGPPIGDAECSPQACPNGKTITRAGSSSTQDAAARFILMTGSDEAKTRLQACAAGTDGFISKPIVPAILEEQIRRLLHRTYWL